MYKLEFKNEYGLTEEQANDIMVYMLHFNRMQDVIDIIDDSNISLKEWFESFTEENQKELISEIAYRADTYIDDYGLIWQDGVKQAIDDIYHDVVSKKFKLVWLNIEEE